jgi:hypothetical protein
MECLYPPTGHGDRPVRLVPPPACPVGVVPSDTLTPAEVAAVRAALQDGLLGDYAREADDLHAWHPGTVVDGVRFTCPAGRVPAGGRAGAAVGA